MNAEPTATKDSPVHWSRFLQEKLLDGWRLIVVDQDDPYDHEFVLKGSSLGTPAADFDDQDELVVRLVSSTSCAGGYWETILPGGTRGPTNAMCMTEHYKTFNELGAEGWELMRAVVLPETSDEYYGVRDREVLFRR